MLNGVLLLLRLMRVPPPAIVPFNKMSLLRVRESVMVRVAPAFTVTFPTTLLLPVTFGILTALAGMITASVKEGTRLADQLEAVPQSVLLVPTHEMVVSVENVEMSEVYVHDIES